MLRRSPLNSKASAPLPAKREREEGEFASVVIERRPARMVQNIDQARPVLKLPAPKVPREVRKVQSIRGSAKGEDCLVRILGCPGDPAMTIWSHAPFKAAGKGMGIKALDVAGAYCCTYCDAVIDGQRPLPTGVKRHEAELDWHMGHLRSLVRLAEKGLL